MHKITAGVRDYENQLERGQLSLGPAPRSREEAVKLLRAHWATRSEMDQFCFDAMMWCGAIRSPGHSSIAAFLRKLFGVLQHRGVTYNTSTQSNAPQWRDGAMDNLPTASFLSHGGRVIIQLPVRTAYDDAGTAFFDWLVSDVRQAGLLITRSAATHALADRPDSISLRGTRRYRITEKRGKLTGIRGAIKNGLGENNHFGVNVALGGAGNNNPFSGNIILPNGAHGHLYIYFNPKEVGQCGGIMVGCENSAPHVTSQTFVAHDWRAISEEFSPCGTKKWPDIAAGPNPKAEAMVVDLSDGWTWMRGIAEGFDEAYLDYTPLPVSPATSTFDEQRLLIYAVKDVLQIQTLAKPRRTALEGHLNTLRNTEGYTRQQLTSILQECGKVLGIVNPNVAAGSLTNAIAIAVPTPVQDVFSACRTGWNTAR
ncbi:hypothetical protein [Roseomonas xinghualingensis]|uniref:hypothetical protein n=1 Tax=Roseomonas xinghualingensis TaxID=2986475 RepID=UPI0021F21C6C|nr:hypothetical protein [Roseomonas sp. SXEYE001]MCV4209676.1 hypothetical protein [Roseomonas sp. SXEYE001]